MDRNIGESDLLAKRAMLQRQPLYTSEACPIKDISEYNYTIQDTKTLPRNKGIDQRSRTKLELTLHYPHKC